MSASQEERVAAAAQTEQLPVLWKETLADQKYTIFYFGENTSLEKQSSNLPWRRVASEELAYCDVEYESDKWAPEEEITWWEDMAQF